MSYPVLDVIVVGAGHAGISTSYYLKKLGLSHLVFERGRTGESWRSQRWDSFRLNTANKLNLLPGLDYQVKNPECFGTANAFADMLANYVAHFQLPVVENAPVVSIVQNQDTKMFHVIIRHGNNLEDYYCRQVVVASGAQNNIKIPSIAKLISADTRQLHASQYRSPEQLTEGPVLVVGSGQSGCQITEDLADSGRKVFLSTSMVARLPRSYRGRDIIDWLLKAKFFDVTKGEIADPKMLHATAPQLTGTTGLTISLQSLAKKGVTLLGKLQNVSAQHMFFEPNAAMHAQFADEFSQKVKDMIDEFILQSDILVPLPCEDAEDRPDPDGINTPPVTSLSLKENNINTIIWATGFTSNFDYIKLPAFDADKNPLHHEGISPIKGLYYLGLPWLRKRKSSLIYGIIEDAEFISEKVYNYFNSQLLSEPVGAQG